MDLFFLLIVAGIELSILGTVAWWPSEGISLDF